MTNSPCYLSTRVWSVARCETAWRLALYGLGKAHQDAWSILSWLKHRKSLHVVGSLFAKIGEEPVRTDRRGATSAKENIRQ